MSILTLNPLVLLEIRLSDRLGRQKPFWGVGWVDLCKTERLIPDFNAKMF